MPKIFTAIPLAHLFGAPRTDFQLTIGDLDQNLAYGPHYLFGVRAKF